jgi:hypothetical protein
MKFSVQMSESNKLQMYKNARVMLERGIQETLLMHGIRPEDFEPSEFVIEPTPDGGRVNWQVNLMSLVTGLEEANAYIASKEQ